MYLEYWIVQVLLETGRAAREAARVARRVAEGRRQEAQLQEREMSSALQESKNKGAAGITIWKRTAFLSVPACAILYITLRSEDRQLERNINDNNVFTNYISVDAAGTSKCIECHNIVSGTQLCNSISMMSY